MNDALASGARAQTYWGVYDGHMYEDGTYMFTVDHEVRVFKSNADDFGGPPYVTELPACAGPVRAVDPTQTHCGTNDLLACQ